MSSCPPRKPRLFALDALMPAFAEKVRPEVHQYDT